MFNLLELNGLSLGLGLSHYDYFILRYRSSWCLLLEVFDKPLGQWPFSLLIYDLTSFELGVIVVLNLEAIDKPP